MKKLLLSLLCVVFVSAYAISAETTYTGEVTSLHSLGANVKTVTLNDVSWNIDAEWYSNSYTQRDGSPNRFTFGSSTNPLKSLNFNTTYFKGKAISEVKVSTRQQGAKAQTSVYVQVGTVKSKTYDLSTGATTGAPVEKIFTFDTPVVADKIEIIWENSNTST
ncbi:MAG: hypothetical protein K2L33_03510, partial [Muribaculaceae bacterium]|nr:hypothetical protein [Muribaculaceae bacterium]